MMTKRQADTLSTLATALALAVLLWVFTGCASVPAECVTCPPPIQLDVSSDTMTDDLSLVPCVPDMEGCYGFVFSTRDFYRCDGGEWVPVESPF